ncbi:MAG: endonuclease MutS2 [Firmicutes bacterium]|nr:endonuclease MutS2 [Bacillota bacterium]
MVQEKTIKKLELDNIRELCIRFASHPISKKLVKEQKLARNFNEAEDRLYETNSALQLIRTKPDLPSGSLPDMEDTIEKLSGEFQLNPHDLFYLLVLLRSSKDILNYFKGGLENPVFSRLISNLSDLKYLRDSINKIVDENSFIKDDASEELLSIRRKLKSKNSEVKRQLEHMLKRTSLDKYLQEKVVVRRGERYCLSVKKEFAYKIPGVIEDTSASGNTVFIEPIEIGNIRGELNILKKAENDEIDIILRKISATLFVEKDNILLIYNTLGFYNFYIAKGLFTRSIKGIIPEINDQGNIKLHNARHPLLFGKVVANDLFLGEGYNNLIISGPNTGGKTVLLKMVGLFALMISLGYGIPANEGSKMSYFNKVLVDIGDEQSIENSLSTFSGHIYNIKEMLDLADSNTLLLFDELGNGTDPKEGSSLAMSILIYLNNKGCHSITTTHYGELKVFAYNTPGFSNASMAFDVRTLEPTYQLIIGTPGSSLGLEVAKRCGLKEEIIITAKSLIDSSELETSQLIQSLEEERSLLNEKLKSIDLEKNIIENLKQKLINEQEALKNKDQKIINKDLQKSQDILTNIKLESENIIKELKELKLNNPDLANKARNKIKRLEDSLSEVKINSQKSGTKSLKKGQSVKVVSLDKEGEVVEADDNKRFAVIKIGIMKINLPYDDLIIEVMDKVEENYRIIKEVNIGNIPMEIDVRGLNVDECIYKLEKYLDQAVLSKYPFIRIIHGMGTGALRKGIWEYLQRLSYIKSFRYGEANEGSIGATIVYLK